MYRKSKTRRVPPSGLLCFASPTSATPQTRDGGSVSSVYAGLRSVCRSSDARVNRSQITLHFKSGQSACNVAVPFSANFRSKFYGRQAVYHANLSLSIKQGERHIRASQVDHEQGASATKPEEESLKHREPEPSSDETLNEKANEGDAAPVNLPETSADAEPPKLEAVEDPKNSQQETAAQNLASSSETPSTPSEASSPSSPSDPGVMRAMPTLRAFDAMSEEDLNLVKGIFTFDTFYTTETIPYQNGAIFRGNMRFKKSPDELIKILEDRLAKLPLKEPHRVFLLENFEDDRPVVVVAPRRNDPEPTSPILWSLSLVLAAASVLTCFEVGAAVQGADIFLKPELWIETWPISLGIFGIQVAHEIGHRIAAALHKVKLSPPFFVPNEQLGTFGAVTNFEENTPNRNALLDIAAAGPAVSLFASLVTLVLGFLISNSADSAQVPSSFFYGSALVGGIGRLLLGDALLRPNVTVNPLVIIGWAGLSISALNLLPIGRLDGARIMQALYGRKTASSVSGFGLILLGLLSLFGNNPAILYYAIFVFFVQREPERPSINEVSIPNQTRTTMGVLLFVLAIAILSPLPDMTQYVNDPYF